MAPPMFHFAMGWNGSAHVSFRNRVGGSTRFISSSVLLVLDGTFVYLFNVVLVARLDLFHLQSRCWCSTGVPSSFNFAVAWIFRAICVSLWLGYPSPCFMVVARLNLYSSIVLLVLVGVQQRFRRYWNPVSLICGTQYSSISFSRFCWSPAEVS